MERYDSAFCGARVVTPEGVIKRTIAVSDGKISALLDPEVAVSATRTYDCADKLILPGAIDTHGHIANKEPLEYGTSMAASGGFTTVIEMPMSRLMPCNDCPEAFAQRLRLIDEQAYVDIALLGGIYPQTIDRLEEMRALGCAGFKAFTCPAGKSYPHFDDFHLLKLMKAAAKADAVIAIHAENQSICDGLTQECIADGRGAEGFEESRPAVAEASAVATICLLAAATGCRVHICHVTCPEAAEVIALAKARGVRVSAETCAQYLSLTSDDIVTYGAFAKCGPPLRSRERVEALWRYVLNGTIDTFGSDGTVYTEQDKQGDFWKAASGFPGMDVALATLLDEGVQKRGLTLERMARLIAENAASIFGLPSKGKIALGYDADLILVDPGQEWTFHAANAFWQHRCDRFAYEGRCYRGRVEGTFVRGEAVYLHGHITGRKGYGRFVNPRGKEA